MSKAEFIKNTYLDDSGYSSDGSLSSICHSAKSERASYPICLHKVKRRLFSSIEGLQSSSSRECKECAQNKIFSTSPDASELNNHSPTLGNLPNTNLPTDKEALSKSKDVKSLLRDNYHNTPVDRGKDANENIVHDSPLQIRSKEPKSTPKNIFDRIMEEADYILIEIFSHLSNQELLKATHVCQMFRSTIIKSTILNCRRLSYLKTLQQKLDAFGKENFGKEKLSEARKFTFPSPRKCLQQIQKAISPKKSLSPISTTLFERFVKAGEKLPPGEIQQKCTKCQFPARVISSEYKAMCTSERCKFVYCTRCYLEFHAKPSECLLLKTRPNILCTSTKILAKVCKKRLRRL